MADLDDKASAPSASSAANPPQVRSRITVVCAECKRLKLKCDRRTPCGSCVKRDTVARCVYSPAAAEKVDLHSLNNRLIQVEQLLAQGNPTVPAQPVAAPGPPVPLTPLAIPVADLHAACLAPLGLPNPAIPPRVSPEPVRSRPSAKITSMPLTASPALLQLIPSAQRLPNRLTAAHTALRSIAAAPFPFTWFEARAYSFISGLTASAVDGSATSSASTAGTTKTGRKRELAQNARRIFSGGDNATHNFDRLAQQHPSMLASGSGSTSATHPQPSSYSGSGYNTSPFSDVPPVHTLAEPDSDQPDHEHSSGSDPEVDELDNDDPDRIRLGPAGANPSNTTRTGTQPRGDHRIALFALICAVLALSADAAEEADLPEADLLALARRAASEYFEPPPGFAVVASGPHKERERLHAEVDAVLAMWTVSVCMMRWPTPPGEELYMHLAQTVTFARFGGLDREAAQRLGPDAKAVLVAKTVTGKRRQAELDRQARQPTVEPGIVKMEEVEECLGVAGPRQKEECVHMLRTRTWWTVCWGDMLAAEAIDLAPTVALGTGAQNLPPLTRTRPSPLNGDELDLLEPAVDWSEEGETSTCFGGRRFGSWARFSRILHHVYTLSGMEGACQAESIIRAWATSEGGELMSTGGPMYGAQMYSPSASPTVQVHVPAFSEQVRNEMDLDGTPPPCSVTELDAMQHRAEVTLLANRAILKLWMAWMAYNPSAGSSRASPPTIPMQAVYGAVGAAHGIVQACRTLQTMPLALAVSPAESSSLALLVDPPMRALFDAGIVCAHAALRYPIAVFSAGAREGLGTALGLLRAAAQAPQIQIWQTWAGQNEAIRVLEGLARRAGVLEDAYRVPVPLNPALKRKHDGPAPESPAKPSPNAAAVREADLTREKEHTKEKKKQRPNYPTVGIRVRPGKEMPSFFGSPANSATSSPVVPAPPRKGSVEAGSPSSSRSQQPPSLQQDEMVYYTPPPQTPSQPQLINPYRSRSSSVVSHSQPPMKETQPTPMEFASPFSAGPSGVSTPLDDFSRRSFELPTQSAPQSQPYTNEPMYEIQSADAYGSSPFGSNGSGSPYNTTAPSGFGGNNSPPAYTAQTSYYPNTSQFEQPRQQYHQLDQSAWAPQPEPQPYWAQAPEYNKYYS
ncbi:Fungal specific transcription [Mycena chlorophos]|uniref:Fungal specific transcription n=1 Tax=Mycena chlorophos TaxID=658473 RepID=A0A8H6WJL2_MYCCL|nr:Fungal specific transcription [Mycena chlorophos]